MQATSPPTDLTKNGPRGNLASDANMTDQPTNTVATDDEIMAAIAAAEQATIPSFEDDSQSSVVAVAVPADPDSIPTAGSPRQSSVGGRAAVSSPAGEHLHDITADANNAPKGPPAGANLLSRASYYAYHAIDTTLAIINRPFNSLSPQRRQLAGHLAIATLVLSLLALYLFPMLIPRRDAVSLLTNKCAALRAPAAAQPAPE